MMRSLLTATAAAVLLGGPAAADMRDAFKKQQKATDYLNSCLHYDKAQWQKYSEGLGRKKLLNGRVLVRSDKTLLFTEEAADYLHDKWLQDSDSPLGRRLEPVKRECRAGINVSRARKLGNHTHLYSDGSGSKNLTVIEGDFLVTYSSGCLKWKCSRYVSRYVLGVRIGSPSYEALK